MGQLCFYVLLAQSSETLALPFTCVCQRFLLLLWTLCQWILCWLLGKQENYNTFPLFLDCFFSVFWRTINFLRNSGKEFLPILLQMISQLSLFAAQPLVSALSDCTSEDCPSAHCAPATLASLSSSYVPGVCSCDGSAVFSTWNTPPLTLLSLPLLSGHDHMPLLEWSLCWRLR